MATINTKATNGVSFGYRHTVTAQDAIDGTITIDFSTDYQMVAVIQEVDGTNVNVDIADAIITYPADGQITIANGTSYTITEGNVISVIAQRNYPEA